MLTDRQYLGVSTCRLRCVFVCGCDTSRAACLAMQDMPSQRRGRRVSCCHPLLLLVLCSSVPLQAGIVTSDILVTVSQGYAAEITGSPQDGRVDMLLAQRAPRLRGIVNGIDVTEWDPATDIHLAEKWVVAVCVEALLQ